MTGTEKKLVALLALVQFCHILDFMIIMPLGNELMDFFSINPQQFAFLISAYAGSAFIFGLFGAPFIDRFDRKQVLLVCFFGFIIGTFLCGISESYYSFLFFRFFTGGFGGLIGTLALSIVSDTVSFERRSTAMGILMMAFSMASIIGVPAGLLISHWLGWQATFFTIVGISIPGWFMFYWLVPKLDGHFHGGKILSVRELYYSIFSDSNQVNALLFSMLLMLGHFSIIPFIAPYMEINIGFGKEHLSLIYMIGGALTFFLLPTVGKLSDLFGNQKIFTIASIFALFSIYAVTNLSTASIALALCVTSSYFIASSGRTVPATTLITSVVKPANRGGFMSVRTATNELALFLASLISGFIINKSDSGLLENYEFVGYFAIAMSIIAIIFAKKLKVIT